MDALETQDRIVGTESCAREKLAPGWMEGGRRKIFPRRDGRDRGIVPQKTPAVIMIVFEKRPVRLEKRLPLSQTIPELSGDLV